MAEGESPPKPLPVKEIGVRAYTDVVTIEITIDELYGLLGAAARDEAAQEKRLARCAEGTENYYDAKAKHRSSSEVSELVSEIVYRANSGESKFSTAEVEAFLRERGRI